MTDYRPTPKSKASALIERLIEASASGATNELSLRRLQQEAKQLMNADVVGAHTVLGGVQALRGDVDGVHHHFRIALQNRSSAQTRSNYSIALSDVGEREAAFEAAGIAQKSMPDDKFLLEHAIRAALESGHFTNAMRLCLRWNGLVPDEQHPLAHRAQSLVNAIEEQAFSEEAVQQVLAILCSVLRKERVRSAGSAILDDPQEPQSFLYEQHVELSCERAAQINAKCVDALVSRPDLLQDPGRNFLIMVIGAKSNCQ